MSAFLPLMRAQAAQSLHDEPACLRFDVWTDKERPDDVFLYELYADRAAFEAHLRSVHFAAFDAMTGDLVSAKRVSTWQDPVALPEFAA